ncbi:MAG: hypothetical protein IKS83_03330, partial [Victivallales bacterium]|nr:hypothetical protein [Victivallales bacterium]
ASHASFNRTAKVSLLQAACNALTFPTLLSSATFEDDQMTSPIPDFTAVWKPLWRTLGYAMLAVTFCLMAAGLADTWRRRSENIGQLGLFAIINLLLQILFVLATRLQFFPHYHQPVLMSSLLLATIGASSLIDRKRGRHIWRTWCALGTASIIVFLGHLALTGGQDRPPYGMTLDEQWDAIRTVQRHALNGEPIHLTAHTWQYSNLPYGLELLCNLTRYDLTGREPPPSPKGRSLMPRQSWVLINPLPGCGFLRIVDYTNPSAPQDVPIER